ncbi:MAG: hypothetical protein O4860_09040 [Trichodesmium sp. St2_bin2_1]|nr:hypothetical protein [Trichodesmium sp. St2_bin2_1]
MITYSAFQIDELHRHNQNILGTLHGTSLLWSTDMKTAVKSNWDGIHRSLRKFCHYFCQTKSSF